MAGSEEVIISMEELHKMRKVVRKEAGQASSRGRDQPVISPEEAENRRIVVQAVEVTLGLTTCREERLNSIRKVRHDNDTSQFQIQKTRRIPKVPSMLKDTSLRDTNDCNKYFEPMMVSIGPYHYGEDKLKPGETLKLKLTQQFFNDGKQQLIDAWYDKIFAEINNLRGCYDEESTKNYDDETLTWMLFVDGCSVLRYIQCDVEVKLNDLKIQNHEIVFMRKDLFLLENQLPFQVLKLLMSYPIYEADKGKDLIEKFILKNVETPERKGWQQQWRQQWQQFWQQQQRQEKEPSHLLELLRRGLLGPKSRNSSQITDKIRGDDWQSFRHVAELRAAGIYFHRSKTNFLNDISFNPCCIYGYVKLPPISVDDSTKAKFLNLVAYEMSPDFENNMEVTSYICFLDSLIDQPDDVKNLRKKYILHNFLGSDEEVAKLFNEIATYLMPNPDIYRDVKLGIQKHYDDKGKAWMAEFLYKRFRSPWTIIAFIAAFLAFVMTGIQTFCTVRKCN
ncbi:hypothetical protein L1049_008475 [Liquidambar formosana]|uniref:Uncharacterized protein n=1 Tax=Liquidambar formosana TaxID=63359 RepID=A0AAP0S6G4_LIQFO